MLSWKHRTALPDTQFAGTFISDFPESRAVSQLLSAQHQHTELVGAQGPRLGWDRKLCSVEGLPQTHGEPLPLEKAAHGAMFVTPALRRWRQEDSWGLLPSQSSVMVSPGHEHTPYTHACTQHTNMS